MWHVADGVDAEAKLARVLHVILNKLDPECPEVLVVLRHHAAADVAVEAVATNGVCRRDNVARAPDHANSVAPVLSGDRPPDAHVKRLDEREPSSPLFLEKQASSSR